MEFQHTAYVKHLTFSVLAASYAGRESLVERGETQPADGYAVLTDRKLVMTEGTNKLEVLQRTLGRLTDESRDEGDYVFHRPRVRETSRWDVKPYPDLNPGPSVHITELYSSRMRSHTRAYTHTQALCYRTAHAQT